MDRRVKVVWKWDTETALSRDPWFVKANCIIYRHYLAWNVARLFNRHIDWLFSKMD